MEGDPAISCRYIRARLGAPRAPEVSLWFVNPRPRARSCVLRGCNYVAPPRRGTYVAAIAIGTVEPSRASLDSKKKRRRREVIRDREEPDESGEYRREIICDGVVHEYLTLTRPHVRLYERQLRYSEKMENIRGGTVE